MSELVLHALVAVAGGLGAAARLLLDGWVSSRVSARQGLWGGLPWGIIAVNLSGSLLIGIAAGALVLVPAGETQPWQIALAIGALGGYTTFSTASYQTVQLARHGRWGAAALNGVAQLVVACLAVAAGWGAVALLFVR